MVEYSAYKADATYQEHQHLKRYHQIRGVSRNVVTFTWELALQIEARVMGIECTARLEDNMCKAEATHQEHQELRR